MSARHPKTTYLRGRAPAHWWYKPDSMNIGQVADPGTTAMARKGLGNSGRKGDQAVWMVAIRTCSGFRMTVFAPSSATC